MRIFEELAKLVLCGVALLSGFYALTQFPITLGMAFACYANPRDPMSAIFSSPLSAPLFSAICAESIVVIRRLREKHDFQDNVVRQP